MESVRLKSQTKMSKFLTALVAIGSWVKKYWYVPVFFLGTLIIWLVFRRSSPVLSQTIAEVRAIQAEAEVAKLKATLGTQEAKAKVIEQYQTEIAQLNEKQKEQAKALENDPAKLAKFLVRTAGKSVNP